MRVLVDVERSEAGWQVRLGSPDSSFPSREHPMARLETAPYVAPAGANVPDAGDPHGRFARAEGAEELRRLAAGVIGRASGGDEIELYGRHLFASLIGPTAWDAILGACDGSTPLELALRWQATHQELHTSVWEALHDGRRFLSAYDRCPVAVTRIVADAHGGDLEPISTSPRVLFAIGSELTDPTIRPGAEFMGLMRAVQEHGSPLTPLVLESASLKRISEAVGSFRPDAVHFICHGQMVAGEPRLLLRPDDDGSEGSDPRPATAGDVYTSLGAEGGARPRIAVLSACETAAGENQTPFAGGPGVTPFAVGLVKAGVPIVVAMSGRVSDTACRLFTRRFGSMLAEGGELVSAAAHARRAAYLEADTPGTIDWLLPAIFLADGVAHDYAPVDAAATKTVRSRMTAYDLPRKPVFCGRTEFFAAYDELVNPKKELTVVVTWWRPEGVGKDRLLRELASRALTDGHVPVFVMSKTPPRTAQQLGAQLGIAIERARENFGLDPGTSSVLLDLARSRVPSLAGATAPTSRPGVLADLGSLAKSRDGDDVLDKLAVGAAIKDDLGKLVADAQLAGAIGEQGRAFVLLADVENWDQAREALFDGILTPSGLGTPELPAPVVLTWKAGELADQQLDDEKLAAKGPGWKRFLELAPLRDEEEILAYQWVLANAWPELQNRFAKSVWVVQHPEGGWRDDYRDLIAGLPQKFREDTFWLLAGVWEGKGEIVASDDEKLLTEYLERQSGG